jgi:hypothetical protein
MLLICPLCLTASHVWRWMWGSFMGVDGGGSQAIEGRMTDICVTVPIDVWVDWLEEGTLPFDEWDGASEYHWFSRGPSP